MSLKAVKEKCWMILGVRYVTEISVDSGSPNTKGLRLSFDTQENMDAACSKLAKVREVESSKPGKEGYTIYSIEGVEVICEVSDD